MKTEIWDMAYTFDRPPPWDRRSPEQPVIVYLDMWCWDRLVRDRAKEFGAEADDGVYDFFKDLAAQGRVVFPLSQATYRENWKRDNLDARWDTAVVMAELSGFSTISPIGLEVWDARVAVSSYLGLDVEIKTPDPFGWGMSHCVRGFESRAHVRDLRTGDRPNWADLTDDRRAALVAVENEAAYRFELATLARREPRLEAVVGLEPFPPVPDEGAEQFHAAQRELSSLLDKHGRTPATVRHWIEFLAFRDSQKLIAEAARDLGVSSLAVFEDVARRTEIGDNALHEFTSQLPIQGTFNELRIRAHSKKSFGFKPSDLLDFWGMATVLPFVDVAMTDRRTFNLAVEGGIEERSRARVCRRLNDLRMILQDKV